LDAVVALRNVTQTIPIVSATLADAVHLGLIANEVRPTALSDPKSGQTLVYVYFEVSPAGDRRRNCLMMHEGIAANIAKLLVGRLMRRRCSSLISSAMLVR